MNPLLLPGLLGTAISIVSAWFAFRIGRNWFGSFWILMAILFLWESQLADNSAKVINPDGLQRTFTGETRLIKALRYVTMGEE